MFRPNRPIAIIDAAELIAPALRGLAGLLVVVVAAYGAGALVFRGPRRTGLAWGLVGAWITLAVLALAGLWRASWLAPFVFSLAGLVFLMWWARVLPKTDREWAADVSRVFHVEHAGSRVTIHNVRDFEWRTREDFTESWVTRDYDIDTACSVDLVLSYWAGPHITHALVSFGFTDGRHLCFSVEVRRVVGGQFSALGGLFRQCELVVIAAEERDIVRTRANVRGERVYLYRVAMPTDDIRALLRSYLATGQALAEQPRFYNTLTANCTTLIYDMVAPIVPGVPWNWRLLVPGHLPAYLYRLNALASDLHLAQITQRGQINAAARAWDQTEPAMRSSFSIAIREDIPVPRAERIG